MDPGSWLSHASTSIHWKGFLSGFVLEGEMSGVLYFELSSCQNNIRSKLVGASALIICFACYSLPMQAGSLRGPRVAGKTDDQCTLTGRNATCERGKILLLVPFLILVWPNEPIKKIQASSHHMHTLTSEHKKNKWRNSCEVLRVFGFTEPSWEQPHAGTLSQAGPHDNNKDQFESGSKMQKLVLSMPWTSSIVWAGETINI